MIKRPVGCYDGPLPLTAHLKTFHCLLHLISYMIYSVLRERDNEMTRSEGKKREWSEVAEPASTEITSLWELKRAAKQALENCMCTSPGARRDNVLTLN